MPATHDVETDDTIDADVIVVGAGNAALCAALAASEQGAKVLVLERAPVTEAGGNTTFTAGSMRVAYRGLDDIKELVPDLTTGEVATTDFGSYPEEKFLADMARVTEWRTDPDLAHILVGASFETLKWMTGHGVRFVPIYNRQAYKVDGRFTFWGGLTIESSGGGPGLVEALTKAATDRGIRILYRARAHSLVHDDDGVHGVVCRVEGATRTLRSRTVVLASGGFQANPEWRTRYLGPNWELAKVRGTRFNTGDGIRMALDVGAAPWGHWSGAHAVAWDRNATDFGNLVVGDHYQKHSYPLSIVVNNNGHRFLDEGADFRNYTYAKYGREILGQPGQVAWQVFDAKVSPLLRQEYRIREVTKVVAGSLEQLVAGMEGVAAGQFLTTVSEYNASVDQSVPFDPNVLDGRGTPALTLPKSNWANTIAEPPFEAYQVTCGITFTFGGLRITPDAEVLDTDGAVIPGLYACGELVGGLFYFNYPGGTGLTAGSVFGRIAGSRAGKGR